MKQIILGAWAWHCARVSFLWSPTVLCCGTAGHPWFSLVPTSFDKPWSAVVRSQAPSPLELTLQIARLLCLFCPLGDESRGHTRHCRGRRGKDGHARASKAPCSRAAGQCCPPAVEPQIPGSDFLIFSSFSFSFRPVSAGFSFLSCRSNKCSGVEVSRPQAAAVAQR